MAIYYVDQTGGADANNGLSPATAWKTMSKLAGITPDAGDSILLKRGEVWREAWNVTTGGSAGNPITYGAYGAGNRPKITGCDLLTGWTVESGSVYKASYTEAIDTYLLLEDGAHLTKVANLAAVNSAGKFWPDNANNLIYAWCTDGADPDTHTMEVGARYDVVSCDDRNYVTFENLHFHGAGGQYGRGFGVKPTWNTPSNIILTNCEIDYCWYAGVWAHYATNFTPTSNIQLNDCTVHDNRTWGIRIEGQSASYRITGLLLETCSVYNNGLASEGGMGVFISHCASPEVSNCTAYDNTGSLEWSDNINVSDCPNVYVHHNLTYGGAYSGIHLDVQSYGRVHYNTCHDHGYNGIWLEEHDTGATRVYHNTCYGNRHGLVFGPGSTIHVVTGVTVKNNIFAMSTRANVELNDEPGYDFITGNDLDYNCYFVDTTDPLYLGEFLKDSPRVAHTFAQWKTETGWDANSLNTDPLLLSTYRPDTISPCIDAGLIIAGINQPNWGSGPDIGRWESPVGTYSVLLRRLSLYRVALTRG